MASTVDVAELRENLSGYLNRVARGERVLITDNNRPIAEIAPVPATGSALERLIAAGCVSRPSRPALPGPVALGNDDGALSRALHEVRGGTPEDAAN